MQTQNAEAPGADRHQAGGGASTGPAAVAVSGVVYTKNGPASRAAAAAGWRRPQALQGGRTLQGSASVAPGTSGAPASLRSRWGRRGSDQQPRHASLQALRGPLQPAVLLVQHLLQGAAAAAAAAAGRAGEQGVGWERRASGQAGSSSSARCLVHGTGKQYRHRRVCSTRAIQGGTRAVPAGTLRSRSGCPR